MPIDFDYRRQGQIDVQIKEALDCHFQVKDEIGFIFL